MKQFSLTIDCDNDAFANGQLSNELARILRDLAAQIEEAQPLYGAGYGLTDLNGNTVGNAYVPIAHYEEDEEG